MVHCEELWCRRAPEQYPVLQTGKGTVRNNHHRYVGSFLVLWCFFLANPND